MHYQVELHTQLDNGHGSWQQEWPQASQQLYDPYTRTKEYVPIQHELHASTHHQSNATEMTADTGRVRPAEAASQKMTQVTHDIPQTASGDIPQQQFGAAQDAEMA